MRESRQKGQNGMSEPLIVTVDGGGTQCRVVIFDADGRQLGHAAGAFANLVTDFEDSRRHITDVIDAAYGDAGMADISERSDIAVLGVAGAEIGDLSTRLESALDFATLRVMSDRDIAVAGILGDKNGTLAQIGTGSFFARQHDGRLSYAGGWGLTLGDECGGAWLGRELLRAVLMAHDGLLEGSPLGAQVTSNFGNGPDGIIMFAATATPADFAELTPVLFEAHNSGDSLANLVVTRAVADLERILTSMHVNGDALFITGGVGVHYKPMLGAAFRDALKEPDGDSLSGAFAIGRALLQS